MPHGKIPKVLAHSLTPAIWALIACVAQLGAHIVYSFGAPLCVPHLSPQWTEKRASPLCFALFYGLCSSCNTMLAL